LELKSVRIRNYRSIDDSGVVPIDDVTCLVGKNESGKTAFLHALHLLNPLNPIRGKVRYDDVMDFPSRRFSAYRKTREQEPADVVTAVFELSDNELRIIESDLGVGILKSREVTVVKGYEGRRRYKSAYVADRAITHLTSGIEGDDADKQAIKAAATMPELMEALLAVKEPDPSVAALTSRLESWHDLSLGVYLVDNYFEQWLPRFFYFSDYSTMRGRVSLPDLRAKEAAGLADEADLTFLSLLKTVDADLSDFEEAEFEALTRELEGAANGITRDVFSFWRQNPGLRVVIQMSQGNPAEEPPLNRGPIVNLRIYNPKHSVTVPFDERSRGFVWFFSFYAYFSNIVQDPQRNTILLLDEPGTSLHASAQADVLSFVEEKLAPKHQVIYTTHSPFLIDPQRIDRVRMVQDLDDQGTTVGADGYQLDSETVFPLQAALSYELAQPLVTGPHCLLTGWPSDLIYLQLLNQACREAGLSTLDPRWVVTAVGGADKVSAFVSLSRSAKVNIAILVDGNPTDQQRIRSLADNGHIDTKSLVQVSDFVTGREADLEDLLDASLYCAIASGVYGSALPNGAVKPSDLKSRHLRITARLDQYLKDHEITHGRLDRYQLAAYFLREQVTLLPKLTNPGLERVAKLFERINSCLT